MTCKVVEDILASYFDKELPACTVIGVSEIFMDASIQIDAIVSNGEGTFPKEELSY